MRRALTFLTTLTLAAVGLSAAPAAAQVPRLDVVELTTSNDIISGSDDLYTASVGLALDLDGRRLRIQEDMFTDRDAGRRHDETAVSFELDLEPGTGLELSGRLGALQVGEGFMGQSVQNTIHQVVGADQVELAYPDDDRWYPLVGLRLAAPPVEIAGRRVDTTARLLAAPGFRSSFALAASTAIPVARDWSLEAGAGVMLNHVESDLLDEHVESMVPTWSAGVAWRRWAVTWSGNTYGTTQGHVALSYRVTGSLAGHGPR